MLSAVVLTVLVSLVLAEEATIPEIIQFFDVKGRITRDGYYSESHHVTTSDGYILEINRIPYGRHENASDANPRRPVVFIMHGLQNSAVSFITLGPESSIGYNLADAGFDVWLGNARGVLNSRNHLSLNPDDDEEKIEFFDFSFEEIAIIDVPTMIDYVLEHTGREQLHYVGHSQGGTVFLVLNSLKPEYNAKFKSVHLLAGVGYQNNFPSTIIGSVAQRTDTIYKFSSWWGYVEVLGPKLQADLVEACEKDAESEACDLLTIENFWSSIHNMLEVVTGSALKQFAHFGQNIRDGSFRRWNYGAVLNLLHYRRIDPPVYNINKITVDVTMHYTVGDVVLAEKDVIAMANVMPNARARRIIKDSFSHTDFVLSPEVKFLVTDYIIEEIKDNYKICEPIPE